MTTHPLDPLLALSTELPDLPGPAMREVNPYFGTEGDPYGTQNLVWYSADQMRTYATEATAYWKEMWRAANARADGVEPDDLVPRAEMLQALSDQRRRLCAETDEAIAERDHARAVGKYWGDVLRKISAVGMNRRGETEYMGEHHSTCVMLADGALENYPAPPTPVSEEQT